MAGIIVRFSIARLDQIALAEGSIPRIAIIPVSEKDLLGMCTEEIAEAVFAATNAPAGLRISGLAKTLRAWFARPANAGRFPALSVGDVVEVKRLGGDNHKVRVEPIGYSTV